MKKAIQITLSILILAGGYWGWHIVQEKGQNEETEKKTKARQNSSRKRNAQQTLITTLTPQDYPVILETQGTVRPAIVTSLTPRVAGRITFEIPKTFNNGATFKAGDTLLELDPTDLTSEVITAKANVARASSALEQEKARGQQALRNWKDIGFDDEPNELVLRVPQLAEAEANLAAQAENLARAERNLKYATIRAPFDGQVRQRNVGPGQTVGTGTTLGEIFATSTAEVRLPISTRQLTQLNLDKNNLSNIHIELSNALQANNPTRWPATIVRIEGELDETSRELFVIATIPDPFSLDPKNNRPPLRFNQPVKAHITANTLHNVVIIPRDALHGSDEIITVTDDQKIKRHTINVVWSTQETVIADDQDLHEATLALSKLPYAPEGSPVKIIEKPSPPETNNTPAASAKSESNPSS